MSSSSRVALVSGSNQGIGLQIVKELCAKFDGDVYLTSRDTARGRAAVEECNNLGLYPRYHQLNLDDEESVMKLRDHLKETYGGLDVLVNNAAILIRFQKGNSASIEEFAKQAETTMQTNYFSLSRACKVFFPLLRAHARVVNISSDFGHLSEINGTSRAAAELRSKLSSSHLKNEELDELMQDFVDSAKRGNHVERGWPESEMYTTYKMSKVGVSALSRIQQRFFDSDISRPGILVNSVHPGWVQTNMSEYTGPFTVERGALAPTYLALLPSNLEEPKGAYIWHDKQVVDWVNGPMPMEQRNV